MRFPIHAPEPAAGTDRPAPAALRLAALGASVLLATAAALGATAVAHAQDAADGSDVEAAAQTVEAEPVAESSDVVPLAEEVVAEPAETAEAAEPAEAAETADAAEPLTPVDPAPALVADAPAGLGPQDQLPVAGDDHYSMTQGEVLEVAAPGFLVNDVDPDGGEVIGHWTTSNPGDGFDWYPYSGRFIYTPDPAFTGVYTVEYEVRDDEGSVSAPATIEIEVLPSGDPLPPAGPVDAPPVAIDDALSAVAGELATLAAPGVLANDGDPEGQPLELVGIGQPAHGVIYYWTADGTVQYDPYEGFAGTDQVEYTVSDGTSTATAVLRIDVIEPANYAPDAWDDEVTMIGDAAFLPIDAPGVLANDSDQDGDPLTVTWHSDPQHGSIDIAPDGSFVYTPDPGFTSGEDSVLYSASDGQADSEAFLTILVLPVGSSVPPTAHGDHYDAMSGQPLDVPAPGLLGNDVAGAGPIEVVAHEDPQYGTLVLDADGAFRYVSDAGYTGVDTFRYTISNGSSEAHALVSLTVHQPGGGEPDCQSAGADGAASALAAIAVPSDPEPSEPCDQPTEPQQPSEPGQPAEPGLPAEPEQPTAADEPARPASEQATAAAADGLAETGADARLGVALAAMLGALGLVLRVARRRPLGR
ncbi:Ig-like domain-containing protein [Agromyces aurantiacus]|uniref:Ig-like domain-containing protein n=1 Tax=Agromyces aurantiacus TaxID=165814 RepID=A0ABV9R0G4_9MICO|nr:Ig-like domain-containing protein [Agromyces aurantiacus]MBM7505733.1 hypothetical protein [Agromyces aurantiacus]